MKGLFIPGITAEMFRNGCLESIEALMAEGEIYDIEYSPWIPCSERLPENDDDVLVWDGLNNMVAWYMDGEWRSLDECFKSSCPIKYWMPLPDEPKDGE